jgi:glyoxylate reductase
MPTTRPRVLVTRRIPAAGLELLKKANYQVDLYEEDQTIPRKELLKRVRGADALLPLLTDRIDEEVLKAAGPSLKVIANYAVGFDNIDLLAAIAHKVPVTNTPVPEMSEAVADHTLALILALAHRVVEGDVYARAKKYQGWSPDLLVGTDVVGKTIGIVGLGRIGSAVAMRAVNGFRMKCLYNSPTRDKAFEASFGGRYRSLEQLLEEADFITLHVPLLPSTRHLISTAEFALMKKSAFLINTSRGPVVDEKALLRALKTKRVAGAALDVFECEPAIDCDLTDKLELRLHTNTILTPHIASATKETREAMSICAAKNIIAVLSGKPPLNPAK